jgi:hypothetical protein
MCLAWPDVHFIAPADKFSGPQAATSSQNKKSDKQKIDVQSLYLSGGGVLSDTVIGIL